MALQPSPPPVAAAPAPLSEADRAFDGGAYEEAARLYENYLRTYTAGSQRDQALFRLGLSYVFRPGAAQDWTRASALFKQLTDEHPNSPLKPAASLILSLRSDLRQRADRIRQLSAELDRLKKIDADRRRR